MILLKNGEIHTVTNGVFYGDILIDNGKIKDIGANINIEGCESIELNGAYVCPGFIESHCHVGLHGQDVGAGEGIDINESTDPITASLRAIDGINPFDSGFQDAREAGITTVLTGPGSANVIGGTFAAIKTKGTVVDKMVIKEEAALKAAFGDNPRRIYKSKNKMPSTRMGVAAILRENFYKAESYNHKVNILKSKGEYYERNLKLEALTKVLNKKIPLKCHCHRADDIATAIRIKNEFNIDITLDHCTEGHLIKEYIKENEVSVIVGPMLSSRGKQELKNKNINSITELFNEGLEIALTTDYPVMPFSGLLNTAIEACKNGVDEEEALKMITISAAKISGIDKRVGSIEVGKDSDLVIFDNNPFKYVSKILYTIIDGKIVYNNLDNN